jgi:hypothetical protein
VFLNARPSHRLPVLGSRLILSFQALDRQMRARAPILMIRGQLMFKRCIFIAHGRCRLGPFPLLAECWREKRLSLTAVLLQDDVV